MRIKQYYKIYGLAAKQGNANLMIKSLKHGIAERDKKYAVNRKQGVVA